MLIEVDSDPNCESSIFARFKETGPPREVIQVRTFERRPEGEWCWVTGWTDDPDRPRCPAHVQTVEDSGAGLAQLIFGGIWGVRIKPVSLEEDWDLHSSSQWGEPYLLLADLKDVRYADSPLTRD